MSAPYQPIACHLHDYLEIACLHRYRLLIELDDGRRIEAQALNTETTADKEEFLVVTQPAGPMRLRLDRLLAVTPLDANARFGRVLLVDDVAR